PCRCSRRTRPPSTASWAWRRPLPRSWASTGSGSTPSTRTACSRRWVARTRAHTTSSRTCPSSCLTSRRSSAWGWPRPTTSRTRSYSSPRRPHGRSRRRPHRRHGRHQALIAMEDTPVLALPPLAATEHDGAHLPAETDTLLAAATARAVDGRGPTVLPALAYGASGEHQSFPGTVSIGTEALATAVVELGRSVSTWADRLVVINGHGGNVDALRLAIP